MKHTNAKHVLKTEIILDVNMLYTTLTTRYLAMNNIRRVPIMTKNMNKISIKWMRHLARYFTTKPRNIPHTPSSGYFFA